MDAVVKRTMAVREVGVVGDAVHGGGWWGRAAGARATTTVTLRCAGRNRRTVSGRELPRTSIASWLSHRPSEDPTAARPGRPAPPAVDGRLGSDLFVVRIVGVAQRLVGHRGPQEADELAGDRDVRHGRALAVLGEVAVAVVQADLRPPGP